MSLCELPMAAFDRLGAMSRNNGAPAGACKPFDKNRDGLVMGEGAAAVLVEDLDFAQARGAKILAEIVGYGATSDAFHVIAPAENGAGAMRAIKRALQDAQISPQDIDWISAHGTGTPLNDKTETMAIKAIFGERAYHVPISATKPLTGHMMGATGALEPYSVNCCDSAIAWNPCDNRMNDQSYLATSVDSFDAVVNER